MKKYLSLMVLFIVLKPLFAQEQKEYIINGLHFNSSADEALGTLRNNGWIEGEIEEGFNFKGNIYGYKNCPLLVETIGSKTVSINIFLPECHSWETLDSIYQDINQKVYEEYRKEPEIYENFFSGITPNSNEEKLEKLKQDSCKFSRNYNGVCVEKVYDKKKGFRVLIACSFGFSINIGGNNNDWEEHFHQKFLGIPLMGDSKAFVSKLQKKHFSAKEKLDGKYWLEGKFAGIKGCNIIIDDSPNVCGVIVFLPPKGNWNELYSDYRNFKDKLSIKYGSPSNITETFEGGEYGLGNNEKMVKLKNGNCKYSVQFDTTVGYILLEISSLSMVKLTYIDGIGWKKLKEEGIEDL